MTEIQHLSSALALDESAVRHILATEEQARREDLPWYVKGMLGAAAWIASLLVVAFGVFLAASLFSTWDDAEPFMVIGLVFFSAGLWMLHRATSFFQKQLATAVALAGMAMTTLAIALLADHLAIAALTAAALAAIGIALSRDGVYQALASAFAIGAILVAMLEADAPLLHLWIALPLPVGCGLLMHPTRMDTRPLAVVLLFTTPLALLWTNPGFELGIPGQDDIGAWLARAVAIVTIGALLLPVISSGARRGIILGACLLIGIVLPPAGAAGLALLALAYALGSRLLALGGIIITGYVLNAFYYDLDTTLLVKSGMLILAGIVLIASWFLLARKGAAQ